MSVFTLIQTIHLNVTRKPLKDCAFHMQSEIHGNRSVFRCVQSEENESEIKRP